MIHPRPPPGTMSLDLARLESPREPPRLGVGSEATSVPIIIQETPHITGEIWGRCMSHAHAPFSPGSCIRKATSGRACRQGQGRPLRGDWAWRAWSGRPPAPPAPSPHAAPPRTSASLTLPGPSRLGIAKKGGAEPRHATAALSPLVSDSVSAIARFQGTHWASLMASRPQSLGLCALRCPFLKEAGLLRTAPSLIHGAWEWGGRAAVERRTNAVWELVRR